MSGFQRNSLRNAEHCLTLSWKQWWWAAVTEWLSASNCKKKCTFGNCGDDITLPDRSWSSMTYIRKLLSLIWSLIMTTVDTGNFTMISLKLSILVFLQICSSQKYKIFIQAIHSWTFSSIYVTIITQWFKTKLVIWYVDELFSINKWWRREWGKIDNFWISFDLNSYVVRSLRRTYDFISTKLVSQLKRKTTKTWTCFNFWFISFDFSYQIPKNISPIKQINLKYKLKLKHLIYYLSYLDHRRA